LLVKVCDILGRFSSLLLVRFVLFNLLKLRLFRLFGLLSQLVALALLSLDLLLELIDLLLLLSHLLLDESFGEFSSLTLQINTRSTRLLFLLLGRVCLLIRSSGGGGSSGSGSSSFFVLLALALGFGLFRCSCLALLNRLRLDLLDGRLFHDRLLDLNLLL